VTGTIQHVRMHRNASGIATVLILNEVGDVECVHADAQAIMRTFATSGFVVGAKIRYSVDPTGVMTSFTRED